MQNAGEMYLRPRLPEMGLKKIFWNDLKLLSFANHLPKNQARLVKNPPIPNDTTITVFGIR